MRKIIQFILLLSLCSCGFQVIYEERTDVVSYAQELASVRIKKDRNRLSQELQNNLYDILNPDYIKAEPKYFLILSTTKSTGSTFTTSTGASGRNKVTVDATYELKNLETGELISSGRASANDNYDVTANRYGTYVADQYIQSNITKIVAQNIRNSLVNDLIEVRKKCRGEVEPEVKKDDEGNIIEEPEFVCPLSEYKTKTDVKPLTKKALKNR